MLQLGEPTLHELDVLVRELRRPEPSQPRLDCCSHQIELFELLQRQAAYGRPTMRPQLDETLGQELTKRDAHRRDADRELARQLTVRQPNTWLEPTIEDRFTDLARDQLLDGPLRSDRSD